MSNFQRIQQQWSQWLRQPDSAERPNVEGRRLKVYQRLVRNNIESFITRGFPVLFSTLTTEQEREMLRAFVATHQSKSPLFSAIGAEFVEFLATFEAPWLPEWSYQLAVYERMEVDVYHFDLPCILPPLDTELEQVVWQVNPSLQWHAFDYPVHTIQPDIIPSEPLEQPCYLAVYRVDDIGNDNFTSAVKFLQLNAVTMMLVDYLIQRPHLTLLAIAEHLAGQLPQFSPEQLHQGLLATVPETIPKSFVVPEPQLKYDPHRKF